MVHISSGFMKKGDISAWKMKFSLYVSILLLITNEYFHLLTGSSIMYSDEY